jgi:hypothetical protein
MNLQLLVSLRFFAAHEPALLAKVEVVGPRHLPASRAIPSVVRTLLDILPISMAETSALCMTVMRKH